MAAPRRRPSSGPLAVWPILRPSQRCRVSGMAEKNAARGGCRLRFGQLLLLRTPLSKRASWRAALCRTGAAAAAYTPRKGGFAICIPGSKIFFGRSRRLPAPIRPTGPSLEPQITIGSIGRRVGRNGAGSRRVRTFSHLYKTVFSFFAVHGGCRLHSGQAALRLNKIFPSVA